MSARDEAVEMIRRICPPHLSADGYGQTLAEKFDAYRTEVIVEALRGAAESAAEIHHHCHRTVCAACEVRRDILDVLTSVADVIGEKATPVGATATPDQDATAAVATAGDA